MGKQVLRAGTSVAANYRAVCRARSRAEFVSKMGVVVEEADKAVFWLEILVETELVPRVRMENLVAEASEVFAVLGASHWMARAGGRSGKGR